MFMSNEFATLNAKKLCNVECGQLCAVQHAVGVTFNGRNKTDNRDKPKTEEYINSSEDREAGDEVVVDKQIDRTTNRQRQDSVRGVTPNAKTPVALCIWYNYVCVQSNSERFPPYYWYLHRDNPPICVAVTAVAAKHALVFSLQKIKLSWFAARYITIFCMLFTSIRGFSDGLQRICGARAPRFQLRDTI